MFATVTWHVGSRLISDLWSRDWRMGSIGWKTPFVLASFAVLTLIASFFADDKRNLIFAKIWLTSRFWSEAGLVLLVYILARTRNRR
ncbi:hypothetical protein J19TS2_11290 [Cohnella xylanilytica]|nr:hypothetical protein J19TS2_11290 [Cohnella xylanilytica]